MTCDATLDLADERTLTCVLPAGHPGPVHEDADGHQWGDPDLPEPEPDE